MNILKNIKLKDFFLIPNLLSILRIIWLVPFAHSLTITEWWGLIYVLINIAIIAATDIFDGITARLLKQETDLGKMLDPTADKIVLVTTCIFLVLFKDFPILILAIYIFKDIITSIAGTITSTKDDNIKQANFWGKSTTVVIAIAIICFVIFSTDMIFWIITYISFVFVFVAILSYCNKAIFYSSGKALRWRWLNIWDNDFNNVLSKKIE